MKNYDKIDWSESKERYVVERVLVGRCSNASVIYKNVKNNKRIRLNTTSNAIWYYKQFIGETIM